MFNKFNYTRYYMKNSIVHKFNPIFKIISILIILITIVFINSLRDLLIIGSYLLVVMLFSKIKISYYLKSILTLKVLIIFIIIINLIFQYSILSIIYTVFKIIYVVLVSSILTYTTSPSEITYGLEKFLSPFKKVINIKDIALSITLALRFIPSITQEANRIIKAQASRGIDFYNSNLRKKLESISLIFVPMFVLSLRRSLEIADVMNVRLYNYYDTRVNYRSNRIRIFDCINIVINVIIVILVIIY